MHRLTRPATLIRNNSLRKIMWLLLVGSAALLGVAMTAAAAYGQSQYAPIFPKYQVLGVVYAPPGSASSVTYGSSKMVGSTNSIVTATSADNVTSTSYTTGFSLFGLGTSVTNTTSDGWGTANTSSKSYSVQTTTGNAVTTMGPVSSSLGVNHDNDIIYIWLNPVAMVSVTNTVSPYTLNWGGLQFNSCDTTDTGDQVNFLQLMNGCDPNQYPYPDIVGIPVWCLKNPYFPGQSCAQWLPFTARPWDLNSWGTDSNGVPLGPGLTLQDYADILSADPFVTQTLVPANYIATAYCHSTYGVNVDPNDDEIVPTTASLPLPPSGMAWPANFCGTPGQMQRFDPYGTVQYPVPGINGEPQTYSGTFAYSTTSQFGSSATDTHNHSENTSVTSSFGFSASYGLVAASAAQPWSVILSGGFNFSMTNSSGSSWTWSQTHNTSNTNQSTSSASYSITGPQASDNYTGPAVFDVYTDNVYGTFAFYSNEQRQFPPILISAIGVTATSNFGTVTVGQSSAGQQITLTNNSPYLLTMVAPAVSFSDPGFQIVAGSDGCSNVQLQPFGTAPYTCTMTVQFQPVVSDAPNTIQTSYPVHANLVAAGTENISSWQNILVTSTGSVVSGTAAPSASTLGATLYPNPVQTPSQPNTYAFATAPNTGGTAPPEQQAFVFKNYYSSSVVFASGEMVLTDAVNFSVLSDTCAGQTITIGNSCTFTLQYLPKSTLPSTGVFTTKVSAMGVVTGSSGLLTQLAFAGASGTVLGNVTLAPNPTIFHVTLYRSGSSLPTGWAVPITLSNNTSFPVGSWVFNSCPNGVNGGNNATCGRLSANINDGVTTNCPTTLLPAQTCTAEGMYSTADVGSTGTFTGIISATGTVQTTGSPKLTAQVSTTAFVTAVNATKIKINGSEQSTTVTTPAKYAKAAVTVAGTVIAPFTGTRHVALTVGGYRAVASYNSTATSHMIAVSLAAAANTSASPVTAAASGNIVTFKYKVAGAAGNVSYAATDSRDFTVSAQTGSLSGGADAVTTTKYDGGSVSASVGNITASSNWGKTSTPQSMASGLAASLNSAAKGAFTASANGSDITIAPAPNTPSTPTVTVNLNDTKGFTPPSFTATTGN